MLWNKSLNSQEQILAIKISLLLLLGVVLCLFFLIGVNFVYLYQSEKASFSADVKAFSTISLGSADEKIPFFEQTNVFLQTEAKLLLSRLSENIIVIRRDGKIQKNGFFQQLAVDPKLLMSEEENGIYQKKIYGREFLIFPLSIQESTVYFTRDITSIYRFEQTLIINALLLSLLFFLIGYLVSLKLANITLKPIKKNNESLREYNHYVAHELKTPLSVLKSNIEVMELGGTPHLLTSSKEEINGMEKIINGLLFLSENTLKREQETINLVSYTQEFLKKHYPQELFSYTVKYKEMIQQVDSLLIERLLKNIVENALRYGDTKKGIHITFKKNSLYFENNLLQEKKIHNTQKLFEMFYQEDTSRNTQGHGLGLAIVKKICDLYKWKVNIEIEKRKFCLRIDM